MMKAEDRLRDVPTQMKLWGPRSPLDWMVPTGWTQSEWDNHWVIKWKNCVFENTVKKNEN